MEQGTTHIDTLKDIKQVRQLFPILQSTIYGKPLVYFDNGATTQKPVQVIEAMNAYYRETNSNVHRGVHYLSGKATDAFETVRKKVQCFLNAAHEHEIIYTSGTTAAINLVASSFGKKYILPGDTIIISSIEHHANIVPWQMMAEERGASLKIIPMLANGDLDMEAYASLLDEHVKLVAVNYVSNALGTVNPIEKIIELAHHLHIPVLIDAAQAVQHMPVDVQKLDVDFLVFSGHKMYGPTGIGVLYGKEKYLDEMPPYMGGGEMIQTVTFEKTTYQKLPFKFEAGTPAIAEVIGLGAAIDFLESVGIDAIHHYESALLTYLADSLKSIQGLRFIGEPARRAGVVSFLIGQHHPFDVGEILDKQGIAVRTGHHCAEPLMRIFNVPGTVRASIALYNTRAEVDALVHGLQRAVQMLG
ncbi:MAG TPA: cysteine desulfurase [Ferruginibacter sp.]|nr:cysteine desulfurase [Ferruginibacter sp.]HRO18434.1 cysteine desulfurase [Ferruginibacter sp.]HRQ20175.1 cysteine desulfurase [Ferruginibacter sp.]